MPMQDTTLTYIAMGVDIKGMETLFGKRANAVLFSDASRERSKKRIISASFSIL